MTAQIVATYKDEEGREVLQYDNGMLKDAATGHLMRGPDHALITTSERGRELVAARRAKGIRAQLRGMARGADIDLDPDMIEDELISKAADAGEVYTAHFGKTFLKSNNIRGLGEAYSKLMAPFATDEKDNSEPGSTTNILVIDADTRRALEMLQDLQKKAAENAERK
jgi:hypothetical protein